MYQDHATQGTTPREAFLGIRDYSRSTKRRAFGSKTFMTSSLVHWTARAKHHVRRGKASSCALRWAMGNCWRTSAHKLGREAWGEHLAGNVSLLISTRLALHTHTHTHRLSITTNQQRKPTAKGVRASQQDEGAFHLLGFPRQVVCLECSNEASEVRISPAPRP